MKADLRHVVMLGTAGLLAFAGLTPAQAAVNNHASCVGITVSTETPEGRLDVDNYKGEAEDRGYAAFGQFVADSTPARRNDWALPS